MRRRGMAIAVKRTKWRVKGRGSRGRFLSRGVK